jgi:hypothetical protein
VVRRTRRFSFDHSIPQGWVYQTSSYVPDNLIPHVLFYYSIGIFNIVKKSLGDWSDGGTPGHIPNPVVKPVSADGTWGATLWESRSLPRDFLI